MAVVSPPTVGTRDLVAISKAIRRDAFQMCHKAKIGHLGSAFSIVDILTALYFSHLKVDPKNPKDPLRDRFILSKGHGCSTLYVTLAHARFFPKDLLQTFVQDGSRMPGHPSSMLLPGIEASTGSLGHGLNIGIGMALASKRSASPSRTVVIVSDGECDEGSTWEAVLCAGNWKLGGLTCIVDYNKIQSFGRTSDVMDLEPMADKWRAFKWHVQEVNGHDHAAILEALKQADTVKSQPSVIIAHTVKGKGVSFMEDTVDWHYWTPTDEHCRQAMRELA
jgi:transketolase